MFHWLQSSTKWMVARMGNKNKESGWSGCVAILMIPLLMLFGLMKLVFNWKHIDVFATERMKLRPKPRPRHPIKVRVWAGINKKGATNVCILWMHHCSVKTLLPFIQNKFPPPITHTDVRQ